MGPIWDPSGQPAYQTHVKPGCTPHWIHGTHIGMFAGMYLHVHEPVRHYTYHSATDSKSGLFLKPFLTFITYRLPWHLVVNIKAPVPRVRLIILCHKMVNLLSTYRLLSRLVFKHHPSFL